MLITPSFLTCRLSHQLNTERFTPLLFDVTDEKAVHTAADLVHSALQGQKLTALVNNAGKVMCPANGMATCLHLHDLMQDAPHTFDIGPVEIFECRSSSTYSVTSCGTHIWMSLHCGVHRSQVEC